MKKTIGIIALMPGFFAGNLHAAAVTATVEDPSAILGPASAGRGGATVASEASSESVLQNPAAAIFQKKYAVGVSYIGAGDGLEASIVDTKSGPIGGGVYYLKRDMRKNYSRNPTLGNYSREEEQAAVGISGQISDQLGIGTNLKWAYRVSNDPRLENAKSLNFDVGARYLFSPRLSIGILGQNLMTDITGLSPKQFIAGFEWNAAANLMLSAQITSTTPPDSQTLMTLPDAEKTVGYAVGGAYFIDALALRAGYSQHPAWQQNFFSLGLGYDGKTYTMDYSFESALLNDKIQIHRVGLTAFF